MWLSVSEIHQLKVSGLPSNRRHLSDWLKKTSAVSRPRKAKGGGAEYELSTLPSLIQLRVAELSDDATEDAVRSEATQCQTAIDRAAILSEFDDFKTDFKGGMQEAVNAFVKDRDFSARTLNRWRADFKKGGIRALASNIHKSGRKSRISEECEDHIVSMLLRRSTVSAQVIYDTARLAGYTDLSYSFFTVHVKRIREERQRAICAFTDPDRFNSKYRPAGGSASEHVVAPNQLWEIDSTVADIMLLTEEGPKRYNAICVIDVFTRRAIFFVSRTSTAEAVGLALRKAIIAWGVPQVVKMDNGRDYMSKSVRALLKDLGIKRDACTPFHPWEKPHVERWFKSFQHHILELVPGFTGHNVAERSIIEAEKAFSQRLGQKIIHLSASLTPTEFQAFADSWIEIYHQRKHKGLENKTPQAVIDNWPMPVQRIKNVRALDVLLLPQETRIVTKQGLGFNGIQYDAPELGARIGDRVTLRHDPHDLGYVYIFDLEGTFLCTATNAKLSGISRNEIAAKKREIAAQAIKAEKAALKQQADKISVDEIVRRMVEDAGVDDGKIVRAPFGATHTTEALKRAAKAHEPDYDADTARIAETALVAPIGSNVTQLPADPMQAGEALFDRDKAGETLSDADKAELQRLLTIPKFQSRLLLAGKLDITQLSHGLFKQGG